MKRYKNLGKDSGIYAYEIGRDYIKVQFIKYKHIYTYDYLRPGKPHVDQMKSLAEKGEGLNEYINRNAKKNYSRKEVQT